MLLADQSHAGMDAKARKLRPAKVGTRCHRAYVVRSSIVAHVDEYGSTGLIRTYSYERWLSYSQADGAMQVSQLKGQLLKKGLPFRIG